MARIIMMTDFSEAYPRRLLIGVAKYAHDIGEAWTLCRLNTIVRDKYGIDAIVEYASRFQADVVIGQFYESDNLNAFTDAGIIPIAQEFASRNSDVINITGEHHKAGKSGAEYYINKGFHNFAFLGINGVVWSDERLEGFKSAVQNIGKGYTFSQFKLPHSTIWQNYDMTELSTWLKALPKPVAIMACDDNQAFLVVEVCRHLAINENITKLRIPDDVAILSVTDIEVAKYANPPLTTYHIPAEEIGYVAADLLISRINGYDLLPHRVMLPSNLIVRGTV